MTLPAFLQLAFIIMILSPLYAANTVDPYSRVIVYQQNWADERKHARPAITSTGCAAFARQNWVGMPFSFESGICEVLDLGATVSLRQFDEQTSSTVDIYVPRHSAQNGNLDYCAESRTDPETFLRSSLHHHNYVTKQFSGCLGLHLLTFRTDRKDCPAD